MVKRLVALLPFVGAVALALFAGLYCLATFSHKVRVSDLPVPTGSQVAGILGVDDADFVFVLRRDVEPRKIPGDDPMFRTLALAIKNSSPKVVLQPPSTDVSIEWGKEDGDSTYARYSIGARALVIRYSPTFMSSRGNPAEPLMELASVSSVVVPLDSQASHIIEHALGETL